MTGNEKIEKRRAHQRQYYRKRRKAERVLNYLSNLERTKAKRKAWLEFIQKITCGLLVVVCSVCLTACNSEQKTLYHSESVTITQTGKNTVVYDLLADREYHFIAKRIKRSKAIVEAYTATNTDTIKIEIIPSGLRVYDKTANKIFTYRRKSLHNEG